VLERVGLSTSCKQMFMDFRWRRLSEAVTLAAVILGVVSPAECHRVSRDEDNHLTIIEVDATRQVNGDLRKVIETNFSHEFLEHDSDGGDVCGGLTGSSFESLGFPSEDQRQNCQVCVVQRKPGKATPLECTWCPLENRCTKSTCKVRKGIEEDEAIKTLHDTIGEHIVDYDGLPVNKEFSRNSDVVQTLAQRAKINVLEIGETKDEGRVRARIQDPAGWISYRNGGVYFVKKVQQADVGDCAHKPSTWQEFMKGAYGPDWEYEKEKYMDAIRCSQWILDWPLTEDPYLPIVTGGGASSASKDDVGKFACASALWRAGIIRAIVQAGLEGSWSYGKRGNKYKLEAAGGQYKFSETLNAGDNVSGTLIPDNTGWYIGLLTKGDNNEHHGYIRVKAEHGVVVSNFRNDANEDWGIDIIAVAIINEPSLGVVTRYHYAEGSSLIETQELSTHDAENSTAAAAAANADWKEISLVPKLCELINFKTKYCEVEVYGVNDFDVLRKVEAAPNGKGPLDVTPILMESIRAGPLIPYSPGAGKSGSTFLKTADERFTIKTGLKTGWATEGYLNEPLNLYQLVKGKNEAAGPLKDHFAEHQESLLNRYYGLVGIKFNSAYLNVGLIMQDAAYNMDAVIEDYMQHGHTDLDYKRYDLKGKSRSETEKAQKQDGVDSQTLLNGEFMENEGNKLNLTERQCWDFRQDLAADLNFLSLHNMIDYSLYVTVTHGGLPQPPQAGGCSKTPGNPFCIQEKTNMYTFSLIDYLRDQYTIQGKFANYDKKIMDFAEKICPADEQFFEEESWIVTFGWIAGVLFVILTCLAVGCFWVLANKEAAPAISVNGQGINLGAQPMNTPAANFGGPPSQGYGGPGGPPPQQGGPPPGQYSGGPGGPPGGPPGYAGPGGPPPGPGYGGPPPGASWAGQQYNQQFPNQAAGQYQPPANVQGWGYGSGTPSWGAVGMRPQ